MSANLHLPELIVCGRVHAAQILRSAEGAGLRYIVSINNPATEQPPDGFAEHSARKLVLHFYDVERSTTLEGLGEVSASQEHLERLIAFCRGVDGPTLIHCSMGFSRSTAAAYVLLCIATGRGHEVAALEHLCLTVKRRIAPNRRVVWLADDLLHRGGAMKAAHRARFADRFEGEPEL